MKTNNNILILLSAAIILMSCTFNTSNKQDNDKAKISESLDTITIKAESIIEQKVINSASEILGK